MAKSRGYMIAFTNVSVAAIQDLFAIYAGANMAFEVEFIRLAQHTLTTIGSARIRNRRLPATVTSGSGGNAFTPRPINSSDAAATITARINDTVQATTTGTADDWSDGWDIPFGHLWLPPEDGRLIVKPNQAFIVSIDNIPATMSVSGHVQVREMF